MVARHIPTEEEVIGYMTSLSNWGRWGPDDELGTINLITPAKMAQAGRLVKEGISVSCSRPIVPEAASDKLPFPPLHFMQWTGESAPSSGSGASQDFIGFSTHGAAITHLDSLCHVFWDAKMYNGKSASLVTAREKATVGGVHIAGDGLVTRGVLLDIAQVRGKEWLDPGDAVFLEDLEAAEKAQGVRVEPGDALLLRWGWYKRRERLGPPTSLARPGLHAATLPWLHQRGVALLVADASQDVDPSGYSQARNPIHAVGIVAMGLWLIDAANCEELASTCNRLNRWEFMFMVAPLRFHNATGSPVNPLAVF